MRNEMGNNNTSEKTKEEDKASDEVVKTENQMSPEASGAGLSSCSDDTKHHEESSESIEKEKEDTEPVPEPDSQFPQILTELCNPESTLEGINEKLVELNLKESGLQINSQVCISEGKEDTMPEPEVDSQFPPELCNPACVDSDFSIAASTNEESGVQINSQVCISKEMNTGEVEDSGGDESANDPDKIHEKIQTLPIIQPPDSAIESVGDEIHLEENEEDFVQEQSDLLEEKVLEMDTISEKSEFLAYIESENEFDSIKKTEIHRKIDDLTVSVKEIDKQSMLPDLDNVCHNIEEVSAISLTITSTTENDKLLPEMTDHTTLGTTAAETEETLSKQSNEENAIVETSKLIQNCDDQELVEEVAIRSNGEKKSPSFDFDIPLVILKSEECDQTTPLLHHDKNIASRSSFSGYNSNILINERGGIIRMERSDSVVSRSSSLIKRDGDADGDEDVNVEYVQEERKQSHFSDDEKAIELPVVVEELALTKQKGGRGNRKPKSLLFGTCICCTANFD